MGLKDGIEYKGYNSNPLSANTDGDACSDIKEVVNVDGNTAANGNDLATVAGQFEISRR